MAKDISANQLKKFQEELDAKANHNVAERAVTKNGILATFPVSKSTWILFSQLIWIREKLPIKNNPDVVGCLPH